LAKVRLRSFNWFREIADLRSHCNFVIACINGGPVETINRRLVDHRYFYEEGGFGTYACGIARIAAARQLRYYGVSRFGDGGYLSALNQYINNPSVTGFFLEQAVLSSITSRGLDISREISGPMKAIMFPGKVTRFDENQSGPVLYWPLQFNYPAVDAIIVRFDNSNKRKKCFIYPLQITVAKSHSDSEESFFRTWDYWTNDLKDRYDLEVEFFWITADETPSSADLNEKSFSLRSGNKLRPSYKRVHIPLKTVNEDIWRRYRLALLSKEGG
jgi:hypothetical protein